MSRDEVTLSLSGRREITTAPQAPDLRAVPGSREARGSGTAGVAGVDRIGTDRQGVVRVDDGEESENLRAAGGHAERDVAVVGVGRGGEQGGESSYS